MRTSKKSDHEGQVPGTVEQDSTPKPGDGEQVSLFERWDSKVVRAKQDEKPAEAEETTLSTDLKDRSSDETAAVVPTKNASTQSDTVDTSKFSLNFQANMAAPARRPIKKKVTPAAEREARQQTATRRMPVKKPVADSARQIPAGPASSDNAGGRAVEGQQSVTARGAERNNINSGSPPLAGSQQARPDSAARADKNSPKAQAKTDKPGNVAQHGNDADTAETGAVVAAAPMGPEKEAAPPVNETQLPVGKEADYGERGLTTKEESDHLATRADSTLIPAIPGAGKPIVTDPDHKDKTGYRSYIVWGFLMLLLGFGGFGTWSVLAPLKSGVTAGGFVKLAGERKTIQHLEGGIIKEILVNEGDTVAAGQVLVRLDDIKVKANLDSQTAEYYSLLAKQGRLESERDNLDSVRFSQALLDVAAHPEVQKLIAGEERLFAARKASINDQLEVFDSWSVGYEREIDGLLAQKKSVEKQLVHINDELKSVQLLYKKGLIDKPTLLKLKRAAAGLDGQIGSYTANIARAEQKIGESKLRSVSLITQRTQEVSTELQAIEASLQKIDELLPALKDIVSRLEIRAPRAGRVVGLKFHTTGGVINGSTPIMDIVPEDDKLIVEAMINPTDIDIVVPGVEAQIQLTAYSSRKTPQIPGTVLQVSADRMEDQRTGEPYYQALIEIDPAALKLIENVKLYPGMPASIQIVSGERTPLDYLLSPIEAGLRNTWLED